VAAMKEDKYLISFNLLIGLAVILQFLSFWGIIPALDMIGSFVIAAIALIGLVIGLVGQYRNPIEKWGSVTVSISLVLMTFFVLPWSFYPIFIILGIIPYFLGLYRQKQETEKQESSTPGDESLA
jgi:membrane-bound ClpP family serine protease